MDLWSAAPHPSSGTGLAGRCGAAGRAPPSGYLQQAQLDAGSDPAPISWPAPPEPNSSRATFELALARWQSLRSPTAKTALDARSSLQELVAHAGTDQVENSTAEHVSRLRDVLLETATPATVKRQLGLLRAVLKAAASDGLPIAGHVIERLGNPISGSSGTSRKRRPFTTAEAAVLWHISHEQQGPRPLDRWAIPLGLSLARATRRPEHETRGCQPDRRPMGCCDRTPRITPAEGQQLSQDSSDT